MKLITGTVRSAKMAKTVVVEVTRMWQHPMYLKRVKRTKRYLVHDELGAKVGDRVTIGEVRPLSKLKRFKITEIIKK
jgi:small subunit ribosomal protein S17